MLLQKTEMDIGVNYIYMQTSSQQVTKQVAGHMLLDQLMLLDYINSLRPSDAYMSR